MAAEPGRAPLSWRGWRLWPQSFTALWRESLQFRTVLITIGLSSFAILVIGAYLSFSVQANLFQSRLDQVLGASNRADIAAQRVLESSDAADRAAVQGVFSSARGLIETTSSSQYIALIRVPDQEASSIAPQDLVSPGLSSVLTPELRAQVQADRDGQFWQSVSLANDSGGADPGVVVGTQIEIPEAGRYELYLGYSFADADQTLRFVQLTGSIGAIALLIMLAVITLFVVRWVIDPIRQAALTSRRLAGGDLEVRMPEKGADELATLARSFNGMADSLQARIAELAELSVMQQRFVSDVSHELRTPLTTIRLAGDVLDAQRESFPPDTARTVELLHTQTERFELLLSDLLEISRYDAGSVTLALESTNLVQLAGDAIESMHTLAEQRGSDVRLVAPGGHFDSELDPRRIRRIVRNLLGNAIEHGEGRPIVVTVDSDEAAVALAVRDYGFGMTPEDAERVFDRFWRADPSRKRTIGGTGLGLAISLEDAVAHGGRLEVWSAPSLGSCFRLTLPRHAGDEIPSSPIPLPPEDAAGTATAVLDLIDSTGSVTTLDDEPSTRKGARDA
ncbi:MtrAB system histidine kinase MtrB [Agromyces atrinae]|uniref:Sensor histidine kinase MtrB n=1 Tax=Agromyces atrinae TaxID=592376 RepID=A0A852S2L1_9MICO|nr:MtrAB system histidine kinase MtrB [Agromyces atrinae]NYD66642.1 two-component system sensor histidine kinase MtrB [Agromyces atrinae]